MKKIELEFLIDCIENYYHEHLFNLARLTLKDIKEDDELYKSYKMSKELIKKFKQQINKQSKKKQVEKEYKPKAGEFIRKESGEIIYGHQEFIDALNETIYNEEWRFSSKSYNDILNEVKRLKQIENINDI